MAKKNVKQIVSTPKSTRQGSSTHTKWGSMNSSRDQVAGAKSKKRRKRYRGQGR